MAQIDMQSRRIIEALRSGIPGRTVGRYFSEARPQIMREIEENLSSVAETGRSTGMMITGKYGEGKTHLLNTVAGLACSQKMVVSLVSLGKETPPDKLPVLYQKVISNTYLPGHEQPGFTQLFDRMTPGSPLASEMLLFAGKELETDKLYYLLRAFMNTEDQEERFQLLADLEGDFIANPALKKIYRRIFNETAKFNQNFTKTKHISDYFAFMAYFFRMSGYDGWVLLFDEAELTGRLGKKARLNAYRNMARFIRPYENNPVAPGYVFSMFAFSASYVEDVISGKHEYENLSELCSDGQEPALTMLRMIEHAPQLMPLTNEELRQVFAKIREFHGKAYGWEPELAVETLMYETRGGYLLRTRIRAAIELLDQQYQYSEAGHTVIGEVDTENLTEDVPDLMNEEETDASL